MCWRGVCRASFQTQSALGAPTRPSSEALLPTNCRCRKRRLGSVTSAPVARAFRISTSFRREAAGQRRRVQVWLAAAAVLLFAFGGLLWVRSRPSGQTAAVVVLDLRGRAAARGESTSETSQPSLEVPRNARNLNLELPIGSNEGAYDVALINPNGAELFRTSATAKLEDHIVVLRVDVNLAGISPGSYFLGLRQPGVEWMRFPIRVL